MRNWITNLATALAWQEPAADENLTAKPSRLNGKFPNTHSVTIMGYNVGFPTAEKWFYSFQLGSMPPKFFNLFGLKNLWIRLDHLVNQLGINISIYDIDGVQFPLNLTWIRALPNGNIILALEENRDIINLQENDIYLTIYHGKFRNHVDYSPSHDASYWGMPVESQDVIMMASQVHFGNSMKPGISMPFVNGLRKDTIVVNEINPYDYLEIRYDGLVKKKYQFSYNDLNSFESSLDDCSKVIIHLPKADVSEITYLNDIVIYIKKNGSNSWHLVPVHTSKSIRQLTHNDFSIDASILTRLPALLNWGNDFIIEVQIRENGLGKELPFEANYLNELYKLSDDVIADVLAGIHSNIPEWTGAYLENTEFSRLMSSRFEAISHEMATNALGYYPITKYGADGNLKTYMHDGSRVVDIPDILAPGCTVYEYYANGKLINYYTHVVVNSPIYYCKSQDCDSVEIIEGLGSRILTIDHNALEYTIDKKYDYRFYLNVLLSGEPSDEFTDVTGGPEYSIDESGIVTWDIDETRRRPVIWSDKNFLAYDIILDGYENGYEFSIDHWFSNDPLDYKSLELEPESLELWMNGHSLIEDIDFHVKWPKVVICNKKFLTDDENRHQPRITIRARGLSGTRQKPESGFVYNGLLSNNERFNIRDNQQYRIVVNGVVLQKDQVDFREDTSIGVDTSLNGMPWSITSPTIPLRDFVYGSTYKLRDKSIDLVNRIEDFLTVSLPQERTVHESPVVSPWQLFSPLLNRLIHDIVSGKLDIEPDVDNVLTTRKVDEYLESYVYLLDFEPFNIIDNTDFVKVSPHDGDDVIELTELEYSFIERVNDRYMNNLVRLNEFLRIKV